MTSAALQSPARRRDPDVVPITQRRTLRELILLYAAYLANPFGQRAGGTAAACEGDAATVPHRARCERFVRLYEVTCWGGW